MMLKGKVAIVYGAGGSIGSAVARAYAREGARVFLAGRSRDALDAVRQQIAAARAGADADAGAGADACEATEVHVLDVLDEPALAAHMRTVATRAGRIDIVFDAVGVDCERMLGVALTEIELERFELPLRAYTSGWFLIARLAARHMIPNGTGVIMTMSALPARTGTPLNGGYGPAQAAKEAMTRDLSHELARHGVRVLALRPHGVPDSRTMRRVYELKAQPAGMSWEQFVAFLGGTNHARRGSTPDEVAETAAFLASERASGMTGTTVNLTMGSLDD